MYRVLKNICFASAIAMIGLIPHGQTASAASSFNNNYNSVYAQSDVESPPNLRDLQSIRRENTFEPGEDSALPLDIRLDAMREAALSYGARGGLAARTFQIRQELEERSSYLDKVYDFNQLLIPAPSGLLIEPPIVSEMVNAMIIDSGGQAAAVADRVYDINSKAQIVSTARTWRNYLERTWGDVTPPPDILRPNTPEEREKWSTWVTKGWDTGIKQADEIFESDLNELMADYKGMVRYRMLLAQNMISAPYALHTDRGITGGGSTMRIGDRAVQITGQSEFIPGANIWQPANR